ncbi:MAG: TonB-dependent receptor [Melioribacteraceae bacterium]|nr:MAG: TonB-dependent receptor [Melioribacteraceae bacterium]
MKLGSILIVMLLLFHLPVSGQNNTIDMSGFVFDKETGEALVGANVFIKELNYGGSTNISGYFVIPDIPKGKYTLVCSYIGFRTFSKVYETVENCDGCITIELESEALQTEEVVVSADSINTIDKLFIKPVSKINLTPAQINQIPKVVEADLLRALQTMPGIVSLSDFSSALYVRGGTPDQNLYLIDGTDVYNPEHAFGIFSTFNTNAIKKVEISKGGFGAEYGGRLSSVLDVTNLDGNRNNFEGVFNLSLLSASTTLQTPIGSIGSLSGSFRRTYIDQTLAKAIDDVPDYYFYDTNLKAFFDLGKKDKLTISFFNSLDDLDFSLDKDAEESLSFLYDWGNTTASVNWKHIFSSKLFASFWVTGSRFESNFDFEAVSLAEENYLSDYAFKAAAEYYYSTEMTFKFGAEQKVLHERYDQISNQQLIQIENNRQHSTAYASAVWKPLPVWNIEGGVRMNYFNTDTTFLNIEPRFSLKYRLTENSNLKFATGYYHQYLNRIQRLFFSSIWATANKYNDESSSWHFILGYQRAIAGDLEFEIETYFKNYDNIYQYNENVATDIKPSYYDNNGRPVYTTTNNVFKSGDGKSYGIEFLLRKDKGALTGWVSYALSRTEYEFGRQNQGDAFVPRHDRSHVVNGVMNVDLDNVWNEFSGDAFETDDSKWTLGLNFIYASGQPITVPGSAYYINTLPDWNSLTGGADSSPGYGLYPAAINSYRLPDYIRMDVSVTYEKDYGSWSIAPYLQIFNIGNRGNTWFIQYNEEFENGALKQEIEKVNMLPLLPSLGVTIKF